MTPHALHINVMLSRALRAVLVEIEPGSPIVPVKLVSSTGTWTAFRRFDTAKCIFIDALPEQITFVHLNALAEAICEAGKRIELPPRSAVVADSPSEFNFRNPVPCIACGRIAFLKFSPAQKEALLAQATGEALGGFCRECLMINEKTDCPHHHVVLLTVDAEPKPAETLIHRANIAIDLQTKNPSEMYVYKNRHGKEGRYVHKETYLKLLEEEIKKAPVPMILTCPSCSARHLDEGEFATKPHHTHACQSCGMVWRPALVPTVGVKFLPGFKSDAS